MCVCIAMQDPPDTGVGVCIAMQDPPDTQEDPASGHRCIYMDTGVCIAMQDPPDTQEDPRQDPPDTGVYIYTCTYTGGSQTGSSGASSELRQDPPEHSLNWHAFLLA